MNIFIVSAEPRDCAQMLDDRRLVKMVTETAQMLSAALARNGGKPFYRTTHANHPCTKWVGDTRENFTWTILLLSELNREYVRRYKKSVNHLAYEKAFTTCIDQIDRIKDGPLTPFPNCSMFKEEKNVFVAYKKTMIVKWNQFKLPPRWTGVTKPSWMGEDSGH